MDDFDMQPLVKLSPATIGIQSDEDTRPLSLNRTLIQARSLDI